MPKKELGQHWLRDAEILAAIADYAETDKHDTILEIGPGLGTLTSHLLRTGAAVTAVEFDEDLARKLPGQFPGKPLTVEHTDILQYNLDTLPRDYKVVANVPYYITSKIVEKLMTASNKPRITVLLVQKEVAERIAAGPGDMSILSIAAQNYARAELGIEVPAHFFTPPPKVDSRVVVLHRRDEPIVPADKEKEFFRVVKAGFAARRKKLRSSLSAGLVLSKDDTATLLESIDINPDLRAQDLTIEDWLKITLNLYP